MLNVLEFICKSISAKTTRVEFIRRRQPKAHIAIQFHLQFDDFLHCYFHVELPVLSFALQLIPSSGTSVDVHDFHVFGIGQIAREKLQNSFGLVDPVFSSKIASVAVTE